MPQSSTQKTYLSIRHVAERFDVSVNTIWRWTASSPTFPQPIKFGTGCTRWKLADLEAFEGRQAALSCQPGSSTASI